MVEKDIDKMDLSEIKTEVQRLRDELAKMKRGYDDILYNLDDENFSDTYIQKQSSNVDGQITELDTRTSKMALLRSAVPIAENGEKVDNTQIYNVQTKDHWGNKVLFESYVYWDKSKGAWKQISDGGIYTVFVPPSNEYSEGYKLRKNVVIDGQYNSVDGSGGVVTRNLNLTGNVVWGDSFPVKAQYSADGTSWHDTYASSDTYMRISYNCGTKWSEALQIN